MQWEFIVVLVLAIPIILFPVAFVWYLNLGGIYAIVKEAMQKRRSARRERVGGAAKALREDLAGASRTQEHATR